MGYSDKDIKQLVSVIEQISTFTRADQANNESAYESALKYLLNKGISVGNISADEVFFDNTSTGLTAGDVQALGIELKNLIDTINDHEKLITYYEVVSGTSSGNQVNVPSGGTIVFDKFGSSKDAILSTVDGNGNPTWETPRNSSGGMVTTSMALDGTYIFSSSPVDTNVAIVYVFKIKVLDLGSVDLNKVIAETENNLDILSNRIIVTQENKDTTLGGTIDSSKEYFIDGIIDMGTTQITVPPTGINLKGLSFDLSALTSNEDNYTMFISETPAIGSGNILGMDYYISVTGAGSKVYELYDATGFNAFEFTRINYIDCSSLGDLYDYRQGLELGTGRFGGSPSLTLHGLWRGGYRITTSIVRMLAGTMTAPLFKEGTLFQMNSRFLTDINCDLPTLAPLTDFQTANFPNPSTVQIQGAIITRDGALDADDSNITPNLSAGDLPCLWKDNNGINNTYVGGTMSVAIESTTTINTIGVYELLTANTWLPTGLEHFTATNDGKLQNDGVSPREFEITFNLGLESQANNDLSIKFYKYDDSAAAEIALDYTLQTRTVNNFTGGRDIAFFVGTIGGVLDIGDQIYIKIANQSSTSNITAESGSYFRLEER